MKMSEQKFEKLENEDNINLIKIVGGCTKLFFMFFIYPILCIICGVYFTLLPHIYLKSIVPCLSYIFFPFFYSITLSFLLLFILPILFFYKKLEIFEKILSLQPFKTKRVWKNTGIKLFFSIIVYTYYVGCIIVFLQIPGYFIVLYLDIKPEYDVCLKDNFCDSSFMGATIVGLNFWTLSYIFIYLPMTFILEIVIDNIKKYMLKEIKTLRCDHEDNFFKLLMLYCQNK